LQNQYFTVKSSHQQQHICL